MHIRNLTAYNVFILRTPVTSSCSCVLYRTDVSRRLQAFSHQFRNHPTFPDPPTGSVAFMSQSCLSSFLINLVKIIQLRKTMHVGCLENDSPSVQSVSNFRDLDLSHRRPTISSLVTHCGRFTLYI